MVDVVDASDRVVPQFVIAAVLGLLPSVAAIVVVSAWTQPATRIPVHWTTSHADVYREAAALLWGGIALSLGCAATLQWPVGQLTLSANTTGDPIGPAFLLFLLALGWGALVFGICATRRADPADPADRPEARRREP